MTRHTTTRPAPASLAGRVLAGLVLAALTFGVPAFLAYAGGWPLPSSIPTTWPAWQQLLTTPLSDRAVFDLLLIAGWLIWATFAYSVIDEFRHLHRSRALLEEPDRPGRRFSPIRGLAGLLVATVAAGTVAITTNAASASSASAAPPLVPMRATAVVAVAAQFPADTPQATPPALPAGLGVLVVNGCSHLYTVKAGDTLWHIADECLGDPNRWPEIWDLNKGQFWLEVSGYTRLTDPDLIYPRWTLTLPADATPAADSQVEPTTPPSGDPEPSATATTVPSTPSPTTSASSPTAQPTATITAEPTPTRSSSAAAVPAVTPSGTATGTATPSSTPTPTPSPTPSSTGTAVDDTEAGIDLPGGSWVPWALVAALTAAAGMVWLQRRRRYHPDIPDLPDEPVPLPEPLPTLQRAIRRHPTLGTVDPTVTDPTETEPHTPAMPWPTGGIGLVGDGAAAAARAAIVAALASGGQHHYHQRAEVILDRPTFAALFGDHTPPDEWPRLTVEVGPGHALATALERILYRNRILDEYNLDDLDTLRIRQPSEEALPPILHLALSPAPHILRNADRHEHRGRQSRSHVALHRSVARRQHHRRRRRHHRRRRSRITARRRPHPRRRHRRAGLAPRGPHRRRPRHHPDADAERSSHPGKPHRGTRSKPDGAVGTDDDEDAVGIPVPIEHSCARWAGPASTRSAGDCARRPPSWPCTLPAIQTAPSCVTSRSTCTRKRNSARSITRSTTNASNLRQILAKAGGRLLRDDGRYRLDSRHHHRRHLGSAGQRQSRRRRGSRPAPATAPRGMRPVSSVRSPKAKTTNGSNPTSKPCAAGPPRPTSCWPAT